MLQTGCVIASRTCSGLLTALWSQVHKPNMVPYTPFLASAASVGLTAQRCHQVPCGSSSRAESGHVAAALDWRQSLPKVSSQGPLPNFLHTAISALPKHLDWAGKQWQFLCNRLHCSLSTRAGCVPSYWAVPVPTPQAYPEGITCLSSKHPSEYESKDHK